jgi:hypothetical protein
MLARSFFFPFDASHPCLSDGSGIGAMIMVSIKAPFAQVPS